MAISSEIKNKFFSSYWTLLKRYFYDPIGAILLAILVIVVTNIFLSFVKIQRTTLTELIGLKYQIALYISLSFSSFIFWIWKRKVPKFRSTQAGILFAPVHDESVEKELSDLKQRLQTEVEKTDFQEMIRIKILPPNYKVGPHVNNVRILNKSGARILICGRFEEFTIKGQCQTGFSSLTISSIMLPVHPQHAVNLLSDSIIGKQWTWGIENTIERNVVASNLSEVSRYIIGLSLISQCHFNKAQHFLESLTNEVNIKYGQLRCPIEIKRFKQRVADAYADAISLEIREKYTRELDNENLFKIPKVQFNEWKSCIEKAIKISKNPNFFMQLAIYEFLTGNIIQAKDAINKSRQMIPLGQQSVCDLSEAFLFAFEGNLREAKRLYKKVSESVNLPDTNIMYQVGEFLHQACEKYISNLNIRFLYGIFNFEFGDKNLAYIELEKFCNLAEKDSVMTKWIREARLRINRIKRTVEDDIP